MLSSNLFEYLKWRGDLSFDASPVNTVDGLAFAELSYNHFQGIVSEDFRNQKSLAQVCEDFNKSPDVKERKNMGFGINPLCPELLLSAGKTNRFGQIKVCGYKEIFDEEKVIQFAAITFVIGKTAVVAFRGTDDSITGWEEDFYITFKDIVPSKTLAFEYLNEVASYFKHDIIVCGHSKGGHMAVYAASMVDPKIQKRIKKIYNMDGPGFIYPDFYKSESYLRIRPVIETRYVQSDIVGMLFHHDTNYKVIKAVDKGINQHDPLTWQICGTHLVDGGDFTDESKFFEKTINEWVDGESLEDREKFIKALFQIYHATGYKTNYDIMKNKLQSTKGIIKCFSAMDRTTKKEIRRILGAFKDIVQSELPIFNILSIEK